MIAASDYSDVWMSPWIAIRRMMTVNETHGTDVGRTDRRFKREREAWTTGMFALALTKLMRKEFWVEIETVDNTPDTRLRHIDQSQGHNAIETRNIEIVDWDEHVEDIMEVIRKKCSRAYPADYFLLVHARSGKTLDFDCVIEEMKKVHSPFFEVWIFGRMTDDQMVAGRILPSPLRIDVEIRKALEGTKKQTAFLQREKRGTSTEFRDLGPVYLPFS
jgi:hypothetical protein